VQPIVRRDCDRGTVARVPRRFAADVPGKFDRHCGTQRGVPARQGAAPASPLNLVIGGRTVAKKKAAAKKKPAKKAAKKKK
jgi:hypothetical protein